MAVSPGCMVALGSAAAVEKAGLGDDEKRLCGRSAIGCRAFCIRNLFERSTDVYGSGLGALCGSPWDRTIEGPIHLERSRTIAERCECPRVSVWHRAAGDAQEWLGREVKQQQCI